MESRGGYSETHPPAPSSSSSSSSARRLESISMKLMASALRLLASWGLLPHSQEIYEYLRA